MSQTFAPDEKPTVEEVKGQFEAWRKTRKLHEPIPAQLWKAAARLCGTHRPYIIARKLRLNYNKLKEYVEAALPVKKSHTDAGFVELGFASPNTVCEYVIEMQDPNGCKMRLHSKGNPCPDPIEICKAFWSKSK